MKITVLIHPMGAKRMTRGMVQRIKWYGGNDPRTKAAREYLAYKEAIAWAARSLYKGDPITGPVELNLTFWLPPPASQSAKKRKAAEGTLHTKKPDRDNLEKGVCDALNKIIWKDDGQVCRGRTEKRYSSNPRIEIEIIEIKEDIGA